jgi:HlyD family secretion protein
MKKALVTFVVATAMMAGASPLAVFAQSTETAAPAANSAPTISVMVAKKKPIKEELVVTGSFAAGASVQVAPLVQGYAVIEILAEEGDEVKEGQVLARAWTATTSRS